MLPQGMSHYGFVLAIAFWWGLAGFDGVAWSQEAPAEKPSPAAERPAAPDSEKADPRVEWQLLNARKLEISTRLAAIQKEFANAARPLQVALKSEFEALIGEYRQQLYPNMLKLAPKVYAADSRNFEAGELALEAAFRDQDLETVRKLGEALQADGDKSKYVLNYLGAAYFYQKDYENAKKVLDAAEKAGEIDRALNERSLKVATAHLDYQKDPANVLSAEIVIEDLFDNNNYQETLDLAARLKAAGHNSKAAKNYAAAANYALQNFEEAKKLRDELEAAKELDPELEQRFLQHAAAYVDLWKKEQAIRDAEAKLPPEKALPRIVFHTNRGDIELELFEDQAPNTVANIVNLVETGRYSGIKFHRVIPNFVIQGGDPNTLDDDPLNDGSGDYGYSIKCECYRNDARMHFRGSLSMAHAGRDTGGSQFFITHLPTPHLNPNAEEERGHTVFGRVLDGKSQAVVDKIQKGDVIQSAEVLRKRDHEYKPETVATKPVN